MAQGGSTQGGKGGANPPAVGSNTGQGVGAPGKGGMIQAYGVNPYTNASQGMQQAFNATQGAMAQSAAGQAPTVAATSYNPAMMTSQGYNAANAGAAGYNAAMQQGPGTIAAGMKTYQNPYQEQVIDNTTRQMRRELNMQQIANGDAANAAGAFGGSRHGIVEGVTNAEGLQNIGDMAAAMRHQGFETAAGLSGQDVQNRMAVASQNQAAQNAQRQFNAGNRQQTLWQNQAAQNAQRQFNAANRQQTVAANQGATNAARQYGASNQFAANQLNAQNQMQHNQNQFNNAMQGAGQLGNLGQASFGMGNNIAGQQQQTGAMAQQLLQSILSSGQQGFQDLVSQPEQLLQLRLASLGMNPLNNAGTTTQNTQQGWGVGLGNLLGAAGNMFSFAPITLSSGRFKHSVTPTGNTLISADGNTVREVTFKYLHDIDPLQTCYTGIIAEELGDDSAVLFDRGQPIAVDYSKLERVS